MKKDKTIIVVSLFGLIIIGFLFYNQYVIRKENLALREMLSSQGSNDPKKNDPYIANPVKNQIIKGSKELKTCYKAYLAKNPKIREGSIKIDWQIDTDGDVVNPEVIFSQLADKTFEKCLIENIKQWKFPEPIVKKYVSHLFRFNDVKQDEKK